MWCHAPEGPSLHYKKCSVKYFVPYCSYEQDKPFFVLLFFIYLLSKLMVIKYNSGQMPVCCKLCKFSYIFYV